MQDVSGFLNRFKHLLQKKEDNRKLIIEVIKESTGVELEEDELKVKNNILITNTSGGLKGQLFISKHKIIDEINRRAQKVLLTDLH